MVALPEEMRQRYSLHLKAITDCASQLLICYEYDTQRMQGPPFCIAGKELENHYGQDYLCELPGQTDADFGDPTVTVKENAWLIRRPEA